MQRHLQHGLETNNMDRHHTKKIQSPPDIQNHGPESRHTRGSTSKKAQHGAKRHVNANDSTEESSSEETNNSKDLSSSKTISPSQGIRKKSKHSKSHDLEYFKKSEPPTFDEEIKKGGKTEIWLLGLKKYFRFHD
jgi:hypothetical protein